MRPRVGVWSRELLHHFYSTIRVCPSQSLKEKQEKAKQVLKGNRDLPLMKKEEIEKDPKAKAKLDKMLAEYSDLGKAWILKEELRSIYAEAKNAIEAESLLKAWINKAISSDVSELVCQ